MTKNKHTVPVIRMIIERDHELGRIVQVENIPIHLQRNALAFAIGEPPRWMHDPREHLEYQAEVLSFCVKLQRAAGEDNYIDNERHMIIAAFLYANVIEHEAFDAWENPKKEA